jgi:hypothetical protein
METIMQSATAMRPNTSLFSHPLFLRRVLLLDAATCLVTGLAMMAVAGVISGFTELPVGLLRSAGASLFPIALFMAVVAMRRPIPVAGVWLVIVGNVGWVLGSLVLLGGGAAFNALGAAFITVQALAVVALAGLELVGVRRRAAA